MSVSSDVHTEIEIALGVPEDQRVEAATLYWQAFAQKLGPFLKPAEKGIAVLAGGLDPERAFVALRAGRVVGIAGFRHDGRALVGQDWQTMRAEFGLLGASWRLLGLALLDRTPNEGALLMDGITVAEEARGRGVGSRLLEAVAGHARALGYERLQLDVVDTNPRARSLYEKRGFIAGTTTSYGGMTDFMGFSASTTMEKPVAMSGTDQSSGN